MFGGAKPDMLLRMSEAEGQESKFNTYKSPPAFDLHKEPWAGTPVEEFNLKNVDVKQSENQPGKPQELIKISSENPHLKTGLDRLKHLEMQSQPPMVQIVEDIGADKVDRKMVQSNIITGFRDDKKKAESSNRTKKTTKKKRDESSQSNQPRLLKLQQQVTDGNAAEQNKHGADSAQILRLNENDYK